MFIGHYGVALALKKAEPRLSLGWLFAAAQLVDILWPLFVLLGIEKVEFVKGLMAASALDFVSYPYTHSLFMAIVWSGLAYAAVCYLPIAKTAPKIRAAWIIAAAVLSHWFLDLLVHRPDLPLSLGESNKVGFGLWNSLAGTIILEAVLFCGGLYVYLKATRPTGFRGRYGILILSAALILMYLSTTLSGNTPPTVAVLAIGGLIMGIGLPLLAGWLDRGRIPA